MTPLSEPTPLKSAAIKSAVLTPAALASAPLASGNQIDLAALSVRPPVVAIRAARRPDLAQLGEMITALAAHHHDASAITAEILERDLFGPVPWITALVADGGDGLIGYAILTPLYRAQEGKRGMDLHHLFVREGHRGHGIGQHLVSRARDIARDAGCDYLSVGAATGNVAAHRFYEHMDFKPRPVTGMRYTQALA